MIALYGFAAVTCSRATPTPDWCREYIERATTWEPYLLGFLVLEVLAIAGILVYQYIQQRKARNAID